MTVYPLLNENAKFKIKELKAEAGCMRAQKLAEGAADEVKCMPCLR